jgi:FkbM family methyltransferase
VNSVSSTRSLRLNVAGKWRVLEVPATDKVYASQGRRRLLQPYADLCRLALNPSSVVLDVGANIGLTAIVAASRASRVLAVEAAPSNVQVLARNVETQCPGRIEVFHCAAGAAPGSVRFDDNSTYGHVYVDGSLMERPTIKVPLRTVDDVVAESRADRLDLIKIDVEGFEQDVLEGACSVLDRFEPLVFLEFNAICQIALYDRNPRRLVDFLLARFPEVHVWRGTELCCVRTMGVAALLHDNIVQHRGLNDLVAARRADRIAQLRSAPKRNGLLAALRRRHA